MNSEQSSTTAPSSSCAEEATATNLSTESAAVAVSTDNSSTTAIAAAVTAALVAAGISGSTGDKGTEKLKAAVMVSKKGKKGVKGKNFSQAEIDCMLYPTTNLPLIDKIRYMSPVFRLKSTIPTLPLQTAAIT
jgi:hypothetical protein